MDEAIFRKLPGSTQLLLVYQKERVHSFPGHLMFRAFSGPSRILSTFLLLISPGLSLPTASEAQAAAANQAPQGKHPMG